MISTTRHLEKYHSSRELQENIDRLLWQDVSAASSFADETSKNKLIEAAIKAEKDKIDRWLTDQHRQETFTIYHTFNDSDKKTLNCEIEHSGVIIDSLTGHLIICSTKTICVILTESDNTDGYALFNAYPTVISPYGKPTDEDPTQYVRNSKSWKSASPMRKAYLMAITSNDFGSLQFDKSRVAIVINIQENDEILGKVIINETMATWALRKEQPYGIQKGMATGILKRAFPETFEKVQIIWDAAKGFEITEPIIKTQENNTKTTIQTIQETIDAVTNATNNDQEILRIMRAKQKAQARSKRNAPKKQSHKTKTKKKPKNKNTIQSNKTVILQHVPTKLESEGTPQDLANEMVVAAYLEHDINMYNAKRNQILTLINETMTESSQLYVTEIDDDIAESILQAWNEANETCHDDDSFIIKNAMAERILNDDTTIKPMYATDFNWQIRTIQKIAQDADWQPFVPEKYLPFIENKAVDTTGNHIKRICDMHLNVSLLERHGLIEREQKEKPTIDQYIPKEIPDITGLEPKERLKKLINAANGPKIPSINPVRKHIHN